MYLKFVETPEGRFLMNGENRPSTRPGKGESYIGFPKNFVIVDLETTGLFPEYDSIIEVACLKVRDMQVIDSFQSLIHSDFPLDEFIVELTGITSDMLKAAPPISEVLPLVKDFIGGYIVLGHNAGFDVNFLYDAFDNIDHVFSNNFVDTLRLARRIVPALDHHRLSDIAAHYGITVEGEHRALADCKTTFEIYANLMAEVEACPGIDEFLGKIKTRSGARNTLDLTTLSTDKTDIDESNPIYKKYCVFTGALEKYTRAQAAQIVVDLGGFCENTVTKKTNFLVLGNYDYIKTVKEGKSKKHKQAETYRLKGCDIQIIPESVFYEMISE